MFHERVGMRSFRTHRCADSGERGRGCVDLVDILRFRGSQLSTVDAHACVDEQIDPSLRLLSLNFDWSIHGTCHANGEVIIVRDEREAMLC